VTSLVLRDEAGDLLPLEPERWHGDPTPLEEHLVANMTPPVLDVGCGPGRVLLALGRIGAPALGIDTSTGAVALARARGVAALQRSVFDRLPGEGRWGTVVLLDGNIGIGGDARHLLQRCAALLAPGGSVVAEVQAPGHGWRTYRARLERDDERGPWFGWAVVGADAIRPLAAAAGMTVTDTWVSGEGDRWFAKLDPVVGLA
jgi:SAM-dependent methyltransferase